jgi:hypothetical protein
MTTKPTELEKLQAEYQQTRQRYRAVAPLGGRGASYWRRRFSEAATALESAQGQRLDVSCKPEPHERSVTPCTNRSPYTEKSGSSAGHFDYGNDYIHKQNRHILG